MFPLAEILSAQPAKMMVSATEEPSSQNTRPNQRAETSKFAKMMETLKDKDRAAPDAKQPETSEQHEPDDVPKTDEQTKASEDRDDGRMPDDAQSMKQSTPDDAVQTTADGDAFDVHPIPDDLSLSAAEAEQTATNEELENPTDALLDSEPTEPRIAGAAESPDEKAAAETDTSAPKKAAEDNSQLPQNKMSQHLFELAVTQNRAASSDTAQTTAEQLMRQSSSGTLNTGVLMGGMASAATVKQMPQVAADAGAATAQLTGNSEGETGDIFADAETGDTDLRPRQTKITAASNVLQSQNASQNSTQQPLLPSNLLGTETQPTHFLTDLVENSDPDIFTVIPAAAQHSVLGYSNAPTLAPAQQAALAFNGTNARTISDAIITLRDTGGQIDVALHPEELGRLVFKMETTANGQSVSIFAERPETNEIMRKHMQELQQQLRDMGFGEMSFSFSDGDSSREDRDQTRGAHAEFDTIESQVTNHRFTNQSTRAGLDIRI
jgi:flagellar hook-length control protein FliK